MGYLVDTSILVRLANRSDPLYATADAAILELHRRGEWLRLTPQVLIEFRNVATRPVAANGLGLTATDADIAASDFESIFPVLPESPDIYPAWKSLVRQAGVIGKQVHDARLAAVCHVHPLSDILTFNVSHFLSLAVYPPGIHVVPPASVQSPGQGT